VKTLARPSDKAEVLRRLRTLRPDRTGRWGRMTAPQVVCHLSDAFRILTGAKPVSRIASPAERTLLKWAALSVPVPWPPGRISTMPELDQAQGGTKPSVFADDVAELESLVEWVSSEAARIDGRAHPLFGPLTGAEWLRWGYLHMDHHLRQFGA
jgi:Protein of unknown function (DUF1569)